VTKTREEECQRGGRSHSGFIPQSPSVCWGLISTFFPGRTRLCLVHGPCPVLRDPPNVLTSLCLRSLFL
jgi:hypothetical protein